jgi:hypothetical protein
MLWFTQIFCYIIVKNIQVHLQVFLLLQNTSYSVFKMFLGIFHLIY